jgi:hypothetical protein
MVDIGGARKVRKGLAPASSSDIQAGALLYRLRQQLKQQNITMATKYAFAQGLKELRFHLCQKADHSAATR